MSSRTETVRVFVAVGISSEAREQLTDAADRIRREVPQGIQWANPDGMHLTLKFLGNISVAKLDPLYECLVPVAGSHARFPLELAGLGMFPNRRRPRVLWAGVAGDLDALSVLQQDTENAINAVGHPPERRAFSPHITLGRPRRSVSDAQLSRIGAVVPGLDPPQPVRWQVEAVDVMQSELHPSGAKYTVLKSLGLGAPLADDGQGTGET